MIKFNIENDADEVQKVGKLLGKSLKQYNESIIGIYEYKPFTIYLTNDENDVLGGIKGEILDKVCMVQIVWIHELERNKKHGTALFKKLESFAKENHCKIIQLDTAEFQAKPFYEKIGYSVVAILPENFKGYTTYIMRKLIYS